MPGRCLSRTRVVPWITSRHLSIDHPGTYGYACFGTITFGVRDIEDFGRVLPGPAGTGGPGSLRIVPFPGEPERLAAGKLTLIIDDRPAQDDPGGEYRGEPGERGEPAPAVQQVRVHGDCCFRVERKISPVTGCKPGRGNPEQD